MIMTMILVSKYMEVWIALFLLLCTFFIREGFDPSYPDNRPPDYPDQSYSADLIQAEKHLQRISHSPYVKDLLMLLQRV